MKLKFGSRYGEDAAGEGIGARLEKLRAQLGEIAKRGKPAQADRVGGERIGQETVADDEGFPADRAEALQKDEALVRECLALFGVDYDGLIAMRDKDGNPGVYAQAVQANPALVAEVANSPQPVAAALKVALGFKPVADFTTKYGDTPEKIREAMRAELSAEMKGEDGGEVPKGVGISPMFSGVGGGRAAVREAKPGKALRDVFGK